MKISVNNPELQTLLFGIIFILTLIFTIKKTKSEKIFSISKTLELKGFAMLAIIFSHIGYFLSQDTKFLYPFSVLAGVGVNLFLFLSGFGLTISTLKSKTSIFQFYKKRLLKLFIPMWVIITTIFISDMIFSDKIYPLRYIIQSYFGLFPQADLFIDINSPLWYFTLILFYYLIFPILFWRKYLFLTPLLILITSYYLLKQELPVKEGVLALYKLHTLSFPLGIFYALIVTDKNFNQLKTDIKNTFFSNKLKYLFILFFIIVASYTSIHSGVGVSKTREQIISLITMFSIIFIFVFKDFEIDFLKLVGKFSYEIYLIHWPILTRFQLFYQLLPPFIATYIYLIVFLLLAYLLQKLEVLKLNLKKIIS